MKRNALVGRRFRDLDELNDWLLAWAVRIADERIQGTTHERPAERFERGERPALVPVPARPPAVRERVTSRVIPRDGYVAVEANRFPVPLESTGRTVEVSIQVEVLCFRRGGAEAVEHSRLAGKHPAGIRGSAVRS